jgi:maltose 6'-phosphate phosphatase
MRLLLKSPHLVAGIAALLFVLQPRLSLAWFREARCPDVAERGRLNVLTINLLFTEITNREARLHSIANFIGQQVEEGEPVDIVLLEEVVGGELSGTMNSSLDLNQLLASRGVEYNLRYRQANGAPGLLTVGNTILSRCEIIATLSKELPPVLEVPAQGFEIELSRKVMMSRVEVPSLGGINVYDTHLCSFCDPKDRFAQARVLMKFIGKVENILGKDNPIILGGDFNTNRNLHDDLPVYRLITENNKFIDTYASFNGCTNCCSESESVAGCTFAVPGDPFAIEAFTGQIQEPVRSDYIFIRGTSLEIETSEVVFTSYPWVSDHSGVLTRIRLR